jgi:hypothetical protein
LTEDCALLNILSRDKQIEVIAALCEGVGIRTAPRLTGVNRGTVGSLALEYYAFEAGTNIKRGSGAEFSTIGRDGSARIHRHATRLQPNRPCAG